MTAFLSDPKAQDRVRALDRRLSAVEQADLEDLMKLPAFRRFYYRVVFLMCVLEGDEADLLVKDGVCSAMHSWRIGGMRAVGRTLKDEAIEHVPEAWILMLDEQIRARAADLAQRKAAMTSATNEE